ncbi:MAG TPA: Gldg family protein [Planctomycetota bacterium]|nr:Gldg family protein [Planctomycetota bacterium]
MSGALESWGGRRRALAWLNVGLQVALLLGLLLTASLLARKHARRIDVTDRGTYRLSPTTEDLLKSFPGELQIWLNPAQYATSSDRSLALAVDRTVQLLREFQRRNPRIALQVLTRETAGPEFQRHWPAMIPATVYLLAKFPDHRTNKTSVEIHQMYRGDAATGDLTFYRGESVLAEKIREISGGLKRIVYHTEGHGEVSSNQLRLQFLRQVVLPNEGMELRALRLADVPAVPDDCSLLLVVGPAQAFSRQEADRLKDYLDRGGSLFLAVHPRVKTGLDDLLAAEGISVGENVVHADRNYRGRKEYLSLHDFNAHDINRGMGGLSLVVPNACTIDPIELGKPSHKVVPLVMTGDDAWAEIGAAGAKAVKDPGERQGDLKLMAAVERPAPRPKDTNHQKARLVVWGSVDALDDAVMRDEIQLAYTINTFRWLVERRLMDLPHEEVQVRVTDISPAALSRAWWITVVGFPAFGLVLGVVAWLMRRK